ncbi:hypothetical protein AAGV28_02280 [Flavobacterium sp. FZUC8N2.13]|uniref:RiboL-PSP-HEPN domain-containing protein n=1 Tax=Flavobacterium zubiriense TaxID=3138075 RepID=A0ABV4TB20_9FLAO
MGYYSNLDIDFREADKNPFIADVLGITYEELLFLDYKFYIDTSKNGLIQTYRIEFDKDSPKEILSKIDRLEYGFIVYIQPYELEFGDYYQREYESISKNDRHLEKFNSEIDNLKELSKLTIESVNLTNVLHRQICIGIIGTMETFLSEVFINLTMNDSANFQRFVENHPEFRKRKFELRDIFNEQDKIKQTAKEVMLDTIYHNLPSVKIMFISTFKINFPDIGEVYEYVMMRHDLVHRNGKTKDGKSVITDEKAIQKMIQCVSEFVLKISKELNIFD